MYDDSYRKAVIYCRVSDPKQQTTRGSGLDSQETRCRQYASHRGYDIVNVFRDSVSGASRNRSELKALLKFLKKQKETHVVIVDDISRLARSVEAHIKLRLDIKTAGGKLESPSIEFGEDSDSILVENMLASVSQHQRQKNAEQTKNRMKARATNGYWSLYTPAGYRYANVKGHSGKVLVKDGVVADIVQEALEGFAHGRFATQSEVQRYLIEQEQFPKDKSGSVHFQRVTNMLNKVIYAGYLTIPKWGIHMQPAQHEPLISLETYQKIQERLQEKSYAPARKDISDDFPLRGFVTCGSCGKPMTSCWSKSRNGTKHPYYMCFSNKQCPDYRKSIRRTLIDDGFEELLHTLVPTQELFQVAHHMFKDIWDHRREQHLGSQKSLEKELRSIEVKVDQFLDQIVETNMPQIRSAYEKKISDLETKKLVVQEKMSKCGTMLPDFDKTFRTGLTMLANPYKYWASGGMEEKVNVMRLCFAGHLVYDRNSGFRTAKTTLPFKHLASISEGDYEMVHPERFERPTP